MNIMQMDVRHNLKMRNCFLTKVIAKPTVGLRPTRPSVNSALLHLVGTSLSGFLILTPFRHFVILSPQGNGKKIG